MEGAPVSSPMPNAPQAGFHAIPFPVQPMPGLGSSRYYVFTAPHESVAVEAATAAEAMQKSGVPIPWRITRDIPGNEVLIEMARLLEARGGVAADSANAGEMQAQVQEAELPPETGAEEAGLPPADEGEPSGG